MVFLHVIYLLFTRSTKISPCWRWMVYPVPVSSREQLNPLCTWLVVRLSTKRLQWITRSPFYITWMATNWENCGIQRWESKAIKPSLAHFLSTTTWMLSSKSIIFRFELIDVNVNNSFLSHKDSSWKVATSSVGCPLGIDGQEKLSELDDQRSLVCRRFRRWWSTSRCRRKFLAFRHCYETRWVILSSWLE